jgi:contact-dependent growth inhibition (CDI) system CdiI-like immunity protein
MGFSIGLISDPVPDLDIGVVASLGVIQIGSFQERFIASLMYWSADEYKRHWKQAIERIFHSSKDSCLITSMADPASASFIVWWPMYRVNEIVFIQNQILFFDQLQTPFDERSPYSFVPKRRIMNEDGESISEWSVRIDELEEFLTREY